MSTAQSVARQRIESLLDDRSFVEIGGYVTARNTDFNLSAQETPADGVITGYGIIDGNLVYVYSQDASVLNGTIGEMHAKKIAAIYEYAMKMGAPVIGLIDCAGLRLQEATDALDGFGKIYYQQAMASGVIPQLTGIFGNCGGGLAVVPGLTDFTFMESKKGKLFVNSPNAIKGNEVSKCDTSSASFQSEEVGIVDFVGSEEEILASMRELVGILPANNEDDMSYDECTDDLNRICENLEDLSGDPVNVLSYISDNSVFFETKADYGKDVVTGFIRLNGITVGAVANRKFMYDDNGEVQVDFEDAISAKGATKAADFIGFCDGFNIPVLTLTNVKKFKATKCSEKYMAKAIAKLIYAYTNATVPKVTVVTEEAFGSAYVAMNSKSIGADMVYAWENAKIGMMDAKLASQIMYANEDVVTQREKATEYEELQSSALAAAKRGYVDTIIKAEDTRKYVIGAFEMLFTKRESRPVKKHGTV